MIDEEDIFDFHCACCDKKMTDIEGHVVDDSESSWFTDLLCAQCYDDETK